MRYVKRFATFAGAIVCLLVIGPTIPVEAQPPYQFVLRAASGALTDADTSTAVETKLSTAAITLDVTTLTLADADDEVDFYIQTTYDGGTNWVDCENIHFSNADNGSTAKRVIIIDEALDGPGSIKSITGTDPAAGVEISETVPANAIWSVESISASLVTDAAAADRLSRVTIDDGTTIFYQVSSRVNHTASLTVRYAWAPFGAAAVGVVAATDATMNIPLPKHTILAAGYRFITVTGALEAGDNWGAPQLTVEEWHDPLVLTDGTIRDNVRSYSRPLGSQVRIKTAVTGATDPTYAYSATVLFRGAYRRE
jgi:hypothetical protein